MTQQKLTVSKERGEITGTSSEQNSSFKLFEGGALVKSCHPFQILLTLLFKALLKLTPLASLLQ